MSLKLGAKGIIIPFPKAYLGNKLVFQMQQTKRWYNGYVAIGKDNIYYSLDNGVTWTSSVTYGSSTTPTVSGNVVYGNGAYVAFWQNSASSSIVYTSTDRGETWSSKGFGRMENICFVNNQFFLLPKMKNVGSFYGYVSMDGKNWTELSSLYLEEYETIYDMAYGNGQYVAILYYEEENYVPTTYFYTSTNGVDWNLQVDYPLWRVKLDKIAFGNGKFIAASSESNTYYYSMNGVAWVTATFPTDSICTSLIYSDAYGFMVGREDGSIYCSPTGLPNSWVALEGSVDGAVVDISENGSNLVVSSGGDINKLYYSKNSGKTFTESMSSDYSFCDVASCGKVMVEVEPEGDYEYADFASLITPTSWAQVIAGTKYTGTNTHGIWTIEASSYSEENEVYQAFNNNLSIGSVWLSAEGLYDASDTEYVILSCPIKTAIKPTNMRIAVDRGASGAYIQGLNADTGNWDNLYDIGAFSEYTDKTFTLFTQKYYSQFKCVINGGTGEYAAIREFQINSGTIRKSMTSGLPEGYTELEYIESTGTQYIDTGFKNNQDTRVVMDVQATSTPTATSWFFGGRTSNSDATMGVFYYAGSTKKITADYDGNGQRYNFDSLGATDRLSIDYNKNVLTINSYSKTFTSATFQSTGNIALFGINTAGEVSSCISAKLYACKIYDNGTLVRNYVPCKDSSGVAGLYDLVNDTFYANAGTGTFTAGSIIPDEPDIPIVEPEDEIEFTSLVYPTSWTAVSAPTSYSSTNDYGTWKITATGADSSYPVSNAFNNAGSYCKCSAGTQYITIACPENVTIKPSTIEVIHYYTGSDSKVQGYNAATSAWEDLGTLDKVYNNYVTNTFTLTTDVYYSQFRLLLTPYRSGMVHYVREFKIAAGTLKISTT